MIICVIHVVSSGGIITREDLRLYNASFRNPVNVTIQNGQYVFYNPPPPTSGVVLDFIVNILDGRWVYSMDISSITCTCNCWQEAQPVA